MPFVVADVKKEIEEEKQRDPEFRKGWDESREEYEKIGEMNKIKNSNNKFFKETLQGIIEAVKIEKGEKSLKERKGMSAPTYYVADEIEK